jgi:hypothetical protein
VRSNLLLRVCGRVCMRVCGRVCMRAHRPDLPTCVCMYHRRDDAVCHVGQDARERECLGAVFAGSRPLCVLWSQQRRDEAGPKGPRTHARTHTPQPHTYFNTRTLSTTTTPIR